MNAEEIARELREWNECHLSDMCIETDSQCWKFCNDGDCMAVQAADLIESLQAQLADVTAQREKGCEYCASRFGIATHHINGAGLQTGTNKIANFCPMCGKRLEVEHDG